MAPFFRTTLRRLLLPAESIILTQVLVGRGIIMIDPIVIDCPGATRRLFLS